MTGIPNPPYPWFLRYPPGAIRDAMFKAYLELEKEWQKTVDTQMKFELWSSVIAFAVVIIGCIGLVTRCLLW